MLQVQGPEGRNALHHRVPLPSLWESCKTSTKEAANGECCPWCFGRSPIVQISDDGWEVIASRAVPFPSSTLPLEPRKRVSRKPPPVPAPTDTMQTTAPTP